MNFPNVVYIDGQPHLPRNLIHPDPEQHRKRFPKTYLEELAQSIEKNGLQQPLKVRYVESSDLYELTDGECRWRSTGLIKKDFVVPVIISRASKKESFQGGVVANFQRLSPDPMDEANAYAKLLKDNRSWDTEKLAKEIGKNKSHVETYLALRELHPMLQGMVSRAPKDGQISVSNGYQIVCVARKAKKPNDAQFEILKAYQKGVSLQDAIRAIKDEVSSNGQGALLIVSEFNPTEEAKKERKKLNSFIKKATKLCDTVWDQERGAKAVSAYRQSELEVLIEQLECVEKHIKFVKKNLQTESAKRQIATSKRRSIAAKKAAKKRSK